MADLASHIRPLSQRTSERARERAESGEKESGERARSVMRETFSKFVRTSFYNENFLSCLGWKKMEKCGDCKELSLHDS